MSVEFIFRIIGMIIFGVWGVWFGIYISELSGESPEFQATIFGLVGVLIGLILTPYITIRPLNAIRKKLTQISAKSLFAGIIGLVVSLVVSGLLVSKAQLYIIKIDSKYSIIPQKSWTKTRVNGTPLRKEHVLTDGDVIEIRSTKIRFYE